MSRDIKVFIAGETIDREFDPSFGNLRVLRSHVPDIIRDAHLKINVTTEIIMLQRSVLYEDCKFVLQQITKHDGPVVIICDIETILDMADYIADHRPENWQQPVVLTGARIPYTQQNSDAAFNIGFAISSIRSNTSECGSTQIALHGLLKSSRYVDRDSVV